MTASNIAVLVISPCTHQNPGIDCRDILETIFVLYAAICASIVNSSHKSCSWIIAVSSQTASQTAPEAQTQPKKVPAASSDNPSGCARRAITVVSKYVPASSPTWKADRKALKSYFRTFSTQALCTIMVNYSLKQRPSQELEQLYHQLRGAQEKSF